MTGEGNLREWDAAGYQRISLPHEEWATAIVERLPLAGAETVLDAGCGTGRLTRMLVERLPEGRVLAVDGSPEMVERVRGILRPGDRAWVANLTELELEEPVDAVASSAVFHWISDHEALLRRMRAALRPGGRLAIQCGGEGNIAGFRAVSERVGAREPYAGHLAGFRGPWYYAGVEETERRLREAGFEAAEVWLQPWEVVPPEPLEFMRTLVLAPHLEVLPAELHERFLADVLAEAGGRLRLDYVRLNVSAVAA